MSHRVLRSQFRKACEFGPPLVSQKRWFQIIEGTLSISLRCRPGSNKSTHGKHFWLETSEVPEQEALES